VPNFQLIHFHNALENFEHEAAEHFERGIVPELFARDGFTRARRYVLTELQIQTEIVQPYRFVSLFDLSAENRDADLALFYSAVRRESRERGLISADSSHLFETTRDWISTHRPVPTSNTEHVLLVMTNFVPMMEEDYHVWYDTVHTLEVLDVPGFIGMRRGRLFERQAEPQNAQPANAVVATYLKSDDIAGAIAEFKARARGTSASGIH
jgi:hypothetical protein